MNSIPEWLTAAGQVVTAFGVGLLYWQVREDHRRSRRERAVEANREWVRHLSSTDPCLLNVGFLLDHEQTKLLVQKVPVPIGEAKKWLEITLLLQLPPVAGQPQVLDLRTVILIRAQIMHYLNMLECALSARRHGVADGEIIREQFLSFYDKGTGKAAFSDFRAACGGDRVFPAISIFENELRQISTEVSNPERKTGG